MTAYLVQTSDEIQIKEYVRIKITTYFKTISKSFLQYHPSVLY